MLYCHAGLCASQDQTQGIHWSKKSPSSVCPTQYDRGWPGTSCFLIAAAEDPTKCLLRSPRQMHLNYIPQQTISQEYVLVKEEEATPFCISFNSLCLFSQTFMTVRHHQPLLNMPLFVQADSAPGHRAWEVGDRLMPGFNTGQVLPPRLV